MAGSGSLFIGPAWGTGGGGMVWEDRVLFHSPNWKANIPNPESVELATKEERINNNEET